MFKKIGKAVPVLALGAMLFGQPTYATTGATGHVSPGELKFDNHTEKSSLSSGKHLISNPSSIGFGELGQIDVLKSIPEKQVNDYVRVEDHRGENSGWVLKVAADDLTAVVPDKTTTNEADNLTVKIPISSVLQVSSSNLNAHAGSTLNVKVKEQSALNNGGVAILEASKGHGAGAYTADLTYYLTLPNYLSDATITPDDAVNSKFAGLVDYSHVGLFAGEYKTTVTYSITTAP